MSYYDGPHSWWRPDIKPWCGVFLKSNQKDQRVFKPCRTNFQKTTSETNDKHSKLYNSTRISVDKSSHIQKHTCTLNLDPWAKYGSHKESGVMAKWFTLRIWNLEIPSLNPPAYHCLDLFLTIVCLTNICSICTQGFMRPMAWWGLMMMMHTSIQLWIQLCTCKYMYDALSFNLLIKGKHNPNTLWRLWLKAM